MDGCGQRNRDWVSTAMIVGSNLFEIMQFAYWRVGQPFVDTIPLFLSGIRDELGK